MLTIQRFLLCVVRNTALGKYFFKSVATPDSVKNILCQVLLTPDKCFNLLNLNVNCHDKKDIDCSEAAIIQRLHNRTSKN